jgi:CRP/FNR family cyclic AMP-dependent transcriptional regulator
VIFSQDDPADAIFYIREGKVKLTVVSNAGKESGYHHFGPRRLPWRGMPDGPAATDGDHARNVTRLDCKVGETGHGPSAPREPAFSELFLAHLLARNMRIEEDLVDQVFNSSEKRIACVLLLLANFDKEGRPEPVIAKISQETLAEMIGTTRSRVSFFMNKFRKLGFNDYNGELHIHSSLLNIGLHD